MNPQEIAVSQQKDVTVGELAAVYHKWRKCEPIDDETLRQTTLVLPDILLFLELLGERFAFAARELRDFHNSLVSFQEARKANKNG